jgi:hypothetical protein
MAPTLLAKKEVPTTTTLSKIILWGRKMNQNQRKMRKVKKKYKKSLK